MIRKQNSPITDLEKVVGVWVEQIRHNIHFTRACPGVRPASNSVKTERGEEAAEEKLKLAGLVS